MEYITLRNSNQNDFFNGDMIFLKLLRNKENYLHFEYSFSI